MSNAKVLSDRRWRIGFYDRKQHAIAVLRDLPMRSGSILVMLHLVTGGAQSAHMYATDRGREARTRIYEAAADCAEGERTALDSTPGLSEGDRKSVGEGRGVSGRLDNGGGRNLKT